MRTGKNLRRDEETKKKMRKETAGDVGGGRERKREGEAKRWKLSKTNNNIVLTHNHISG